LNAEYRERLIHRKDDSEQRILIALRDLNHARYGESKHGRGNEKARASGRVRHSWSNACYVTDEFGRKGELSHG
jgi:hypothetical protein